MAAERPAHDIEEAKKNSTGISTISSHAAIPGVEAASSRWSLRAWHISEVKEPNYNQKAKVASMDVKCISVVQILTAGV